MKVSINTNIRCYVHLRQSYYLKGSVSFEPLKYSHQMIWWQWLCIGWKYGTPSHIAKHAETDTITWRWSPFIVSFFFIYYDFKKLRGCRSDKLSGSMFRNEERYGTQYADVFGTQEAGVSEATICADETSYRTRQKHFQKGAELIKIVTTSHKNKEIIGGNIPPFFSCTSCPSQ